jgi:hypothetical protein
MAQHDMNQRKNDVILRLVAVKIGERCHYNCYDLCFGANQCDDEIVRLQLQSLILCFDANK